MTAHTNKYNIVFHVEQWVHSLTHTQLQAPSCKLQIWHNTMPRSIGRKAKNTFLMVCNCVWRWCHAECPQLRVHVSILLSWFRPSCTSPVQYRLETWPHGLPCLCGSATYPCRNPVEGREGEVERESLHVWYHYVLYLKNVPNSNGIVVIATKQYTTWRDIIYIAICQSTNEQLIVAVSLNMLVGS